MAEQSDYSVVGKPIPLLDAVEKVTGPLGSSWRAG